MDDLNNMSLRAVQRMMNVVGATKQIVVAGMAPTRALASECTSVINAMRGRTDNRKRYHIGVIRSELPVPDNLVPGATVIITAENFAGLVEEDDFIEDCGIVTCFIA